MNKLKPFARTTIIFRQCLFLFAFALFAAMPAQAETVNINGADAATLQHYLTGIGAVKANAIIAYRNKHGKFKSLDDLKNVSGIGESTIRKNREKISVSKGVTRLNGNNMEAKEGRANNKPVSKNSSKG